MFLAQNLALYYTVPKTKFYKTCYSKQIFSWQILQTPHLVLGLKSMKTANFLSPHWSEVMMPFMIVFFAPCSAL